MTESWEQGDWMQTYTGRKFYPLAAQPEDIDPLDIAHALSMICRYGGHVQRPYYVAEHCVLLSHAVRPENALRALLHDAAEAYVGDMVRPLKQHMSEFCAVEDRLLDVIGERFGIEGPMMTEEVRESDNRILLDERAALMPGTRFPWKADVLKPLGVVVEGWSWWIARQKYADRLAELLETQPA